MDWQKEVSMLKSPRDKNFWKPVAGQYKVHFLTDGEEGEFEWEGKTIRKVYFEVLVDGEKKDWSVTKGETQKSLYGQLVLIAASLGKLKGQTISLVVKGMGKETSYAILEALSLMVKTEEVQ